MGLIISGTIIIIFTLAGVNPKNQMHLCINQNVLKLLLYYLCVRNMDTYPLNPLIQSTENWL